MPSISEVRQNCIKARALMERSRKGKFAVGSFNLDNQETLIAVCRAAKAKDAPVLVEVSKGEVEAMGLENVRDLVDNYKEEYGIEMFINLDHSPTVEDCKAAIDAGYEFIHIDITQLDHEASNEAIIKATKKVVEYAKKTGALVESEQHYFAGSSNLHKEQIDYEAVKKTLSTPESAKDFVRQTGIDTYAASIGNLHGKYPVDKKLDLDLLRQIREAIDCNISLHGGSGTPGHYFEDAAKIGVSKININSDMRIAYRKTLEKVLDENEDEYAVVKLMGEVIKEVQKVVENRIEVFGSKGKAVKG